MKGIWLDVDGSMVHLDLRDGSEPTEAELEKLRQFIRELRAKPGPEPHEFKARNGSRFCECGRTKYRHELDAQKAGGVAPMGDGLKPPKRRFEVQIVIGGDTWPDVLDRLQDLLLHIGDHGPACSSVSGGYVSGHWVQVTEHPEMTHDRYVAELDAYLDSRKAVNHG